MLSVSFFMCPSSLVLSVVFFKTAVNARFFNITHPTHQTTQPATQSDYTPADHTDVLPSSTTSSVGHHAHSLANSSGLAAANQCWSEWDAWSSYSTDCPKTTVTERVVTETDDWTSVVYPTYKLCDGHPRARATGVEWTSLSTAKFNLTGTPYTTYTTVLPPSARPLSTISTTSTRTQTPRVTSCAGAASRPTCSINNADCRSLFSAWTAGDFSRLEPPCHFETATSPCDNCYISIPSVRLMYFPVTMTGNFCGNCMQDTYAETTCIATRH